MSYTNALYQPSILELAQGGNCRALTYWINSFLSPQGIQVQVQPAPDQFLKILVQFRKPKRRETCLHLRDRIARFICYRLWTLNSDTIRGARIVARMAGDPKVLWQLSVRINSPAALKLRRNQEVGSRHPHAANQLKFRVARALFMSSMTLAGFFLGYWLFYLEVGRLLTKGDATETPALTHSDQAGQPSEQSNASAQAAAAPAATNAVTNNDPAVPDKFLGQVVSQVDTSGSEKVLALTFDDSSQPEVTAQILDVLKQYQVQATFFLSGTTVQQSPDLARRIVAEGHMVGNRGWNPTMENDSGSDPQHEVDDTAGLIEQTTNIKPTLFRPANGRLDNKLVEYAQQKQYVVTLWSVDAQDSLVAAPIVLDNVLRNARSGRIVLLHTGLGPNNQSATLQALPQLITALQQQGYRFVAVPEMLRMQTSTNRSSNQNDTRLPLRKPAIAMASLESRSPG